MAKNIFIIRSLLKQENKSIFEVSELLINVLVKLSEYDKIFLKFVYSKQGFEDNTIDLSELDIQLAKKRLADIILYSNLTDIQKHEKVKNPDVYFKRDFGFLHLIKFSIKNEEQFTISGNIGTKNYPSFRIEHFYGKKEYSFHWYNNILKCIIDYFEPIYAAVTIRLTSFIDIFSKLNVKHPLGWITYFSNDYELQIPDDLEGIEYEHTEKGKYLILTREDFTVSKEAYEEQRDKLLKIMQEIKRRVPEYSK